MIVYGVLVISSLMLWLFHPTLFELLDAVAQLFDATARDREATGAPVPLADDMETFRMEAAPSEIGTTRVVPKPVQPSIRLALTASRDALA
ncbi:hypothetical protein [Mesorhizobium neociceri]|uniref:Uncharacterized protein n=1 Tax=Mesorhizobium neociceri TaxID=1307853 RepID=A0A838BDI5_9HYPH|nr:hypothetical protein [Mesorhizobium neociceri]MBA1144323.1 hypothetical protein [Mesorhizobium neociceri]